MENGKERNSNSVGLKANKSSQSKRMQTGVRGALQALVWDIGAIVVEDIEPRASGEGDSMESRTGQVHSRGHSSVNVHSES